jgi:hypothetical protein
MSYKQGRCNDQQDKARDELLLGSKRPLGQSIGS